MDKTNLQELSEWIRKKRTEKTRGWLFEKCTWASSAHVESAKGPKFPKLHFWALSSFWSIDGENLNSRSSVYGRWGREKLRLHVLAGKRTGFQKFAPRISRLPVPPWLNDVLCVCCTCGEVERVVMCSYSYRRFSYRKPACQKACQHAPSSPTYNTLPIFGAHRGTSEIPLLVDANCCFSAERAPFTVEIPKEPDLLWLNFAISRSRRFLSENWSPPRSTSYTKISFPVGSHSSRWKNSYVVENNHCEWVILLIQHYYSAI